MNTFLKYLPIVLAVIAQVETFFGPGQGKEKREAALDLVLDALGLAGLIIPADQIAEIGKLIDGAVAIYNLRGIFRRKKKGLPATVGINKRK